MHTKHPLTIRIISLLTTTICSIRRTMYRRFWIATFYSWSW